MAGDAAGPLAAGAATLVRDYYNDVAGLAAPSSALVKATLINSTVDLLDENNDGVNDNALPRPNSYEGWGRVDLAAAAESLRADCETLSRLSDLRTRLAAGDQDSGEENLELASGGSPSTGADNKEL